MADISIKEFMIRKVSTLESSSSVKDAAKLMDDKNIGCVVVTKQNSPVGIITERDFVQKIASNEKPITSTLEEVMSSPLIAIGPDESIWQAADSMKDNDIHKLPVIEDNKLVGIITTSDLVEICSIGSDFEMRKICNQIITKMQKEQ